MVKLLQPAKCTLEADFLCDQERLEQLILKGYLTICSLFLFFLLTLCFTSVSVAQETFYTIEDFQVGILYRTREGAYNMDVSDEMIRFHLENHSLGGLPYPETKEKFPGGIDFYYKRNGVFSNSANPIIKISENHPIFTIWNLRSGEHFAIMWEMNGYGVIEPCDHIVFRDLPLLGGYIAEEHSSYSYDQLVEMNPFTFVSRFQLPNLLYMQYGYKWAHSFWNDNDRIIVYTHIYNSFNKNMIIAEYRDLYLESVFSKDSIYSLSIE